MVAYLIRAVAPSFFPSFNFLILGVLGEYVVRIYREVKKRPHFVLESKVAF